MTHIFNGKRWKIQDQRGLKAPRLGECRYDEHIIKIPIDGNTLDELDTCIHESLHASCEFLEEDAVERIATELSKILWKLDWRKEE